MISLRTPNYFLSDKISLIAFSLAIEDITSNKQVFADRIRI